MNNTRRQQCLHHRHHRLLLLSVILGVTAPLVGAYRGTVPIFPDLTAGRKKAAAAAVRDEGNQRQKVFAPKATIKATGLTKTYDTPHIFFKDEHVKALDDITADIHGPGSVALVGETGAGKTSFMKCLAGLEKSTTGDITVTGLRKAVYVGRDITSSTGKTVRQLVRDQVATSLPGQIEQVSRRRNVELTTNTILEALELHGCSRTKDRDLSGGEVYRFALAMAMAKASSSPTPPVLLLDGFFDKSDQRVRYGVEFTLFDLQKKMGVMLVFTARNHQIVMELAKQVVEITDGKITEISTHEKSRYARYVFECMRMDIARQSYRPAQNPARYLSLS
eukprot:jgi/Undpi1/10400/HiC_scaffold_29.g12850.m1